MYNGYVVAPPNVRVLFPDFARPGHKLGSGLGMRLRLTDIGS